MKTLDYLVIGAGIVGLTIARELIQRYPDADILVIDKEPVLGRHSSGRNSGVMHSGIYYPQGSLKARVCADGARQMLAYCEEKELPVSRCGKVVLPLREEDDEQLEVLQERGRAAGVETRIIDEQELREIEPEARSATGRALHVPGTSVIDPLAVLNAIRADLEQAGVTISTGIALNRNDIHDDHIGLDGVDYRVGMVINAAGLHADRIAHWFDVGLEYTILPFKGIYYRLKKGQGPSIRGLVYPVPDLRLPFLGVHFTVKTSGDVYLGPTAIPALGRENYQGLKGMKAGDAVSITRHLLMQYIRNKQGFRRLVHQESGHLFKKRFCKAAQALVPSLKVSDLEDSDKVGLRAQLYNTREKKLEMDFVVKTGRNSVHVLNAISPAFTGSLSFATYIVDNYCDKQINQQEMV